MRPEKLGEVANYKEDASTDLIPIWDRQQIKAVKSPYDSAPAHVHGGAPREDNIVRDSVVLRKPCADKLEVHGGLDPARAR